MVESNIFGKTLNRIFDWKIHIFRINKTSFEIANKTVIIQQFSDRKNAYFILWIFY